MYAKGIFSQAIEAYDAALKFDPENKAAKEGAALARDLDKFVRIFVMLLGAMMLLLLLYFVRSILYDI